MLFRSLDRREALAAAQTQLADPLARQLLVAGLTDKSPALRQMAVGLLDLKNAALRKAAAPVLLQLAATDSSVQVQAAALTALGGLKEKRYASVFTQALGSKSYRVQGAALQGLLPLNPAGALARATAFEADNQGALTVALVNVYGSAGGPAQWPLMRAKYDAAGPQQQFDMLPGFSDFLGRTDDAAALQQGITRIRDLTVKYKANVNLEGLIGLLQKVQQRQATRPQAAETATLVEQAVGAMRAAK